MHRGRARTSAASAKGARSAGSSDADGDQAFGSALDTGVNARPHLHRRATDGSPEARGKLSRPRTPLEPWLTLRRPCIYLPYTVLAAPMLNRVQPSATSPGRGVKIAIRRRLIYQKEKSLKSKLRTRARRSPAVPRLHRRCRSSAPLGQSIGVGSPSSNARAVRPSARRLLRLF
jgi:hypothetical protein